MVIAAKVRLAGGIIMNKKGRCKIFFIRLGIMAALAFFFKGEAQAGVRTIFYLPYANYWINYSGNTYNWAQVIFLGNVRSTSCDENQAAGIQGQIQVQFTDHIERLYGSQLGLRHEWNERIGYWRWDTGDELVGLHARIAQQYPNVVYVGDFFFNCGGGFQSFNLSSGLFQSNMGDTALIRNMGGGKYYFEIWQGSVARPSVQGWYNIGEGILGSDGLIHCIHMNVVGYANPNDQTESYWQIVDGQTITQVRYRRYAKNVRPDPNWGWQSGPTFKFMGR